MIETNVIRDSFRLDIHFLINFHEDFMHVAPRLLHSGLNIPLINCFRLCKYFWGTLYRKIARQLSLNGGTGLILLVGIKKRLVKLAGIEQRQASLRDIRDDAKCYGYS